MKRWLLISSIIIAAVLAFSCSSTLKTSSTSLVTITVGSNQTVAIKAEPATLMARMNRFFTKIVRVPSAVAAIPSVVLSIRVTVSAPDMPTVMITEPVLGQDVVILTIDIPNGNGRVFLVEGVNSSAAVSYWGEFTANLAGGSFSQSVDMLFVGSALSYLYVDISGNDLETGTRSSPFRTITRALAEAAITKGNVAIFIGPGTYVTGETFPIRLQSNTALVCLGDKYTTVIDKGAIAPTIAGAPGAVVNGCRINSVPGGAATIDDTASAMTIINSYVFGDPSPGNSPQVCISLSANSRVAKSTITGCSFNVSGIGINITAGSPTIELNTITANQGTGVVVSGGTPLIQNNQITANAGAPGTGIAVSGGIPIIQDNDIRTNTTGISIANVSPTVTNNTIHNNGTGISVSTSTAFPVINSNSIYCNSTVDMSGSGTISFDATLNSWDHDATTTPTGTPPGPTTGGVAGCPAGTDICSGTLPLYIPFNPAVPGGCLL